MLKGTINYHDGTPSVPFVIGVGEDVKAPREIAALEKQGYIFNDDLIVYYKAWLAGKRQGNISADTQFVDWSESVSEVDIKLTQKQIEQSIISGRMTEEQAEQLIALQGVDDVGEAQAPLAS